MNHPNLSGIAWIVFAATAISASVTIASVALQDGATTGTLLVLRFALLVGGLAIAAHVRRTALSVPFRSGFAAFAIGVIFLAQTGGYLGAVAYIPIALAVLLLYTYPILTALLRAALDRRRPQTHEVAALVIAFAGLAIALNVSFAHLDLRGVALGLLAGSAAAVVLNASERVLKSLTSAQTSFYTSIGAGITAVVLVLTVLDWSWPASERGWIALTASIGSFALFYPAMMAGIQQIGAVPTAILFNLEPPVTIVLAAWWLDQQLTGQQHLGAAMVLIAVLIAQWPLLKSLKTTRTQTE
ncbi:MAG: DMT family transporter [Pseudomonadota bacterium]